MAAGGVTLVREEEESWEVPGGFGLSLAQEEWPNESNGKPSNIPDWLADLAAQYGLSVAGFVKLLVIDAYNEDRRPVKVEGGHVNKVTGEIFRPKGEPTRHPTIPNDEAGRSWDETEFYPDTLPKGKPDRRGLMVGWP